MAESKSYTKTFMLVSSDMAQNLNARSGVELKELGRSVNCLMYLVDAHVYKDCRILCLSGSLSEIDAGLRVLVACMQKLLRAKTKPTFETVMYMHDKSVVHIKSDFAEYLSEHASARLQQVADATHTRIYITDVERMAMAMPTRRLHITGAADNVKDACNRLRQVQVDFEALPADPTRLVHTLRLVLLDRDVRHVKNVRMAATYERLQVETKLLRQLSNLPNKTLFVLTGTLENLYAAHFATVEAINEGRDFGQLRKDLPRDRDYSPDRVSYDKKQEYTSARHPSEERWTTKAILPTPPRVVTSPPPSSSSELAMQEAPVVPPPATPFPYQPVPAPMPSAWDASASGWKLHDAVPASDAWSQDLDRLLQTGTTGDASVAVARPQDPCLPPPPTATTPLTSTTPTPPANNTKPPRLTKGVAGVEELPPRGKPKPSAWTSSASGWRLHDTVPASDAWSQDLDRLLQTSASTSTLASVAMARPLDPRLPPPLPPPSPTITTPTSTATATTTASTRPPLSMNAVTDTEASELPPRGKIVQLSRSTTPVVPQRTTIVNLGGINKSSVDFTVSKGDSIDDRLKRPLSDPPMPPAKIQRTLLSDMATGGGRTVYLADASSSRNSSDTLSSRRHVTLPSDSHDKSNDDSHRQRATNYRSASDPRTKTRSTSPASLTVSSTATTASTRAPPPAPSVASSRAPSPMAAKASEALRTVKATPTPSSVEAQRPRAPIPSMQTQVEMRVDMDTADKILTGGGLRRLSQASNAVVSFQIDPLDANMTKILMVGDLLAVMQVQQEINAIVHS